MSQNKHNKKPLYKRMEAKFNKKQEKQYSKDNIAKYSNTGKFTIKKDKKYYNDGIFQFIKEDDRDKKVFNNKKQTLRINDKQDYEELEKKRIEDASNARREDRDRVDYLKELRNKKKDPKYILEEKLKKQQKQKEQQKKEARLKKIYKELSKLEEEIKSIERDFNKEKKEMKEKIKKNEENLPKYKEDVIKENEKQQKELEAAKEELKEQQEELEKAQGEFETQKKELNKLNEELNKQEEELNKLNEEFKKQQEEELKEQPKEKLNKNTQKKGKQDKKLNKNNEPKEKLNKNTKKKVTEQDVKDKKAEIESLSDKIKSLSEKIKEKEKSIEEIKKCIDDKKTIINKINGEISENKKQIKEVEPKAIKEQFLTDLKDNNKSIEGISYRLKKIILNENDKQEALKLATKKELTEKLKKIEKGYMEAITSTQEEIDKWTNKQKQDEKQDKINNKINLVKKYLQFEYSQYNSHEENKKKELKYEFDDFEFITKFSDHELALLCDDIKELLYLNNNMMENDKVKENLNELNIKVCKKLLDKVDKYRSSLLNVSGLNRAIAIQCSITNDNKKAKMRKPIQLKNDEKKQEKLTKEIIQKLLQLNKLKKDLKTIYNSFDKGYENKVKYDKCIKFGTKNKQIKKKNNVKSIDDLITQITNQK